MRGDIDRTNWLSADRVERVQLVSGCKPDVPAVIGDSIDSVGSGKGAKFLDDFGG
jgi:hypothetical protein